MNASRLSYTPALRVGFLCPHNPYDRHTFSGTAYFAAKALDRHPAVQMTVLGDHRPPGLFNRLRHRKATHIAPEKIDTAKLDAIVGLVASRLLDQIAPRLDIPYLHVTDATPAFLRSVYGWNIPEEADAIEARVIGRAAATIYSSAEIAARGAAEFTTRAKGIPFGINLDTLPDDFVTKPALEKLNLLFVGNDWARKGGEIAVATLERLRAEGVDAHLTVVGRLPAKYANHPAMTGMGFLNKNRPREAARLRQLYENAHILLLPTRADCAPMVIAEAMAHGTPVIATNTGGIGTLLDHGSAGRMLPMDAPISAWAETVRDITSDARLFQALSERAFRQAHGTLSWGTWSDQIVKVLIDALGSARLQRQESAA